VRYSSWVPFLAALTTALPGFAQDTSLLRYDGPDRAPKLAAAAQKEGSFTLYTSFAEKDLPPLTASFEKKYGVRVNIWRAGSEKVLQRTLAEAALDQSDKWTKSFDEVILRRGGR
jgi:iron(III) transport system substrate-binding protein